MAFEHLPGYEMHRALVEHERQKKIDARRAAKKLREAQKRARLKKVPTSELRSEMTRRRFAKVPPETRKAWAEKGKAAAAIARQFCDHRKLAPKLRKHGKNAGLWVCPSCNKPVPAPSPGEDLVI